MLIKHEVRPPRGVQGGPGPLDDLPVPSGRQSSVQRQHCLGLESQLKREREREFH